MKGIDVSFWQGVIDFAKVKLSGIDFVILKAGGSDDGLYTDSCFERNYKNAKENGMHIGCYYYVNNDFDNIDTALKYAEHFAKIIKGKKFDMPVCLDIESTTPSQKVGATTASIAFCEYLENLGYYVSIYSSSSHFDSLVDSSKLKKFDKWVAQWSSNKPTKPTPYGMWQYTDSGKVNGINCNVDMDMAYYDYPNIINGKTITENKNTSSTKNETTVKTIHNKYNKHYLAIAKDIVAGKYGNGDTRKKKLLSKGYDYKYAQELVNQLLKE